VKIHVFEYPTVVWRPLSNEPPRISAHTLYWQKLESFGYIFVADSIDLSSFKFLQWAPKDARVLKQMHNDISRSSKVIHFGTNRKRAYDSIVILVLFCCVSEIELLYAESHFLSTPTLFGRKFRGCSLGVDPWCLGCKERTSQANWWWNYFRRIPTYVITVHQRHRQTETDRRHAIARPRFAQCTIVHRAVKTFPFPFKRRCGIDVSGLTELFAWFE